MGRSWCARSRPLRPGRPRRALPGRLGPLRRRAARPPRRARCWSPRRWRGAAGRRRPDRGARPVRRARPGHRARCCPTEPARRGHRSHRPARPGLRARATASSIGPFVVLGRDVQPGRPLPAGRGRVDRRRGDGRRGHRRSDRGPSATRARRIGSRVVHQGGRGHRRRRLRLSLRRATDITGSPTSAAASSRTRWRSAPTPASTAAASTTPSSGAGTKLDNLVHVGHNVRIGRALPADGGRGHRRQHADRERRHSGGPRRRHRSPGDRRPGPDRRQERRLRRHPGRRVVQRSPGAAAPAVPPGPGGPVPAGADHHRAGAAGAGARRADG